MSTLLDKDGIDIIHDIFASLSCYAKSQAQMNAIRSIIQALSNILL